MSEQLEPERLERAPVEGRYRYLADLGRQDSPNLRKHYRNSFSRHENSNQRLSPSRCSPYISSHKRASRAQRFSPACSTFNPRREPTQDEFSPYDDRHDKQQERMSRELRQQNMQLRAQLTQASQTIEALRLEMNRRQGELIQAREANQADLKYFQKVVTEMTGEIQVVLTKNKILENQLVVARARLQEEQRRLEDYVKAEDQRRKHQQRRRDQYTKIEQERRNIDHRKRDEHSRDQKRFGALTNSAFLTHPQQSRRSVGKLIGKSTTNQLEPKQQSLQTSKIKIQEDSQSQSNIQNKRTQNLPPPPQNDKQTRKGQQLIESIISMQAKITGVQSTSLKQLWKWLKALGHSQSCLKRWKSRAQSGMYLTSQRLRQLIKQGCSYIQ